MELRSIMVEGRLWRDKTYGNTYNSSRLWVNGQLVQILEMRYGYGDQYIYEALREAVKAGLLPAEFDGNRAPSSVAREMGVDFYASARECLKKEMFKA